MGERREVRLKRGWRSRDITQHWLEDQQRAPLAPLTSITIRFSPARNMFMTRRESTFAHL